MRLKGRVLVCVCCMAALLLCPLLGFAAEGGSQGLAASDAPASADGLAGDVKVSSGDEMQDYGWLYREGDCWYAKVPFDYEHNEDGSNRPQFILADDGFVYEYYSDYLHGHLDRYRVPVETYYTNDSSSRSMAGEIVYQQGYHVDIDKLAGETRHETARRYRVPMVNMDSGDNVWLGDSLNTMFERPGQGYRVAGLQRSSYWNGKPYLENRGVVRKVTFEDNFAQCFEAPPAESGVEDGQSDGQPGRKYDQLHLYYIDGWFEDFINLAEIDGLEYVRTGETKSMAHAFDGCVRLASLDLSSFDTSSCSDFSSMFDNCASLETLTFGNGWTQANASGDKRATFPVNMRSGEGVNEVKYAAGAVIPDGAATYTVDRIDIRQGTLSLKCKGAFVAVPASFSFDCTGSAIEPAVKLEVEGVQLTENDDYTVRYLDNTQCGTATAIVVGEGAYFGSFVVEFDIVDQAAYAFLFSSGLMVLKSGSAIPGGGTVAGESYDGLVSMRWFDSETESPGTTVPWAECRGKVKRVVLDGSFSRLAPVSADRWFENCTALRSIEGWGNLNVSSLASAKETFKGCSSLASLDLSALTTVHPVDFGGFLQGCASLETLVLGNLSQNRDADFSAMLAGCTGLKSLETRSGWRNAAVAARQLKLPGKAYQVSPTYARCEAGRAIPAGAAQYRLSDLAMQFTKVIMGSSKYACTGKALEPKIEVMLGDVKLVEGVDYSVGYADNVYPGTAKATVLGRGVFSGGLVVPFEIESRVTKVGDRIFYRTNDVVYTFKVTKLHKKKGKVVGVDAKVIGVQVQNVKLKTLSIPSRCSIAGITVDITMVDSKLVGKFRNATTAVIGARVTVIGPRAFMNAKKLAKLIVKSARLQKVTNCLAGSSVKRVIAQVKLKKAKRNVYKR